MLQFHAPTGDPVAAQLHAARATAHHGPAATGPRHGTALCLSGGGFRASLFHLGAVRRLDELGVLGRLRTVSAVSGGAIVANLLTDPRLEWPDPLGPSGRVGGLEEFVVDPLRRLTSRNVRTPALLARLRPRRGGTAATTQAVAAELLGAVPWWDRDLRDVRRAGPAVLTSATEVGYGVTWSFADARSSAPHGRVGDHRLGYAAPPPGLRVVDAVTASLAYPPIFEPLVLDGAALGLVGGVPDPDEEPLVHELIGTRIELVDGGVVDNLALEQVWADHEAVLVSDGGAVSRGRGPGSVLGRWWHLMSIASSGGHTTRLRWLRACFSQGLLHGATWSLESPNAVATAVPEHRPTGDARHYPPGTVAVINRVRTDLDAFDPAEQMVLERHGYLVCDDSMRRYAPHLVSRPAPVRPPHESVEDPAWAAELLAGSDRITPWGRSTPEPSAG
ncbi:patatin-like phospholipase family protein [Ornithinicoccus hortensis]|uniref:NTE family protein n=1 Tax=Ornithinicoccus hortensis TaxID=82346 RepID=A0A542YQM4_9MICO|nr:patatin-like phospholipase family protein [Ornithinicoccus hortensis]TQL50400.1 NTE family protein [Ornithinicoccus hortensis]